MNKNEIAVHVFDKCAEDYEQKYMDVSKYHDTFDLFCKNMPNDAAVLDIACGPGNVTKYLLEKRPDLQILGIDLSSNMVALAEKNNPLATFQVMDCRQISTLSQQYDGIVCAFFLPYLSKREALELIKDATQLLKPNGVLYLSTMEDKYEKSTWKKGSTGDKIYMHYHEASYLSLEIIKNGYEKSHSWFKDFTTSDGEKMTDLIIVATK
jgi:2-polyprenyl-3-methyl-5-hydroxy-6-metoxy-1,4-benzoquinol methylase